MLPEWCMCMCMCVYDFFPDFFMQKVLCKIVGQKQQNLGATPKSSEISIFWMPVQPLGLGIWSGGLAGI